MPKVLVIGATGTVGREVVAQLPAGVAIRALVRDPRTAALPSHVELTRGDLTRPDSLDAALDSVDAVFLVWTAPSAAAPAALDRILARVRRIVFLSAPHKTPHPFFQNPQPNPLTALQLAIEAQIEASGCDWTFLRPGIFASNARFWWGPQIRAGVDVIRWPYAASESAPTDERDIAAVAVRALCDPGHRQAEYLVTGPESLTQAMQLSIIGEAIGRPLRMQEISPDDARTELLSLFPEFVLKMLMAAWSGGIAQPALVTSTVADIVGAPPRTFREWAVEHAALFRGGSS